jgi:hypothetical protein
MTMDDIKALFKELYREVFKISFLHAFTDSLICLFVALNLTTLLDVSFIYAFIASFIFLLADLAYRMKKTTLKTIEEGNPEIRDILSTARDNANKDNFMVLAMFEDLIKRMKTVSSGSFMEKRGLLLKVGIMCALSFSIIVISSTNLHVPKSIFDPDTYNKFFSKPGKDQLRFYTMEFNESSDIYGDPELAGLGNRQIELQINPSVNEMSFENVKPPEEKEFERGAFPEDIYAQSDAASEEKLPKEAKIAIAYNLKIKEGES